MPQGPASRIDASRSVLLLVDLQERLLPHVHDAAAVLRRCLWLARVAARLEVPRLCTEQNPAGLGPTSPRLRAALGDSAPRAKTRFSAWADGCLQGAAGATREQWVVAGCEAHVCVLQTALDLVAAGRRVFVVADAVGSRRPGDRALALQRLRDAGATPVSSEMVAFEWLQQSGTEAFRDIHRAFLR